MTNRFTTEGIAAINEDPVDGIGSVLSTNADESLTSTNDESTSTNNENTNSNEPNQSETPSESSQEPQLTNKDTNRVVFATDSNGLTYFYTPVNPEKYSPESGFNMDAIRKDVSKVFPSMADVDAEDTKRWTKAMQEYSVLRFCKKELPKELLLDKLARV